MINEETTGGAAPEKQVAKKTTKEPTAYMKIDNKVVAFQLDSDNTPLLETLAVDQRNKDTKKSEKKEYYYLPIDVVYQLLEQFYPNYSIDVNPVEMESKFIVKKSYYDKFKKQQVESENEIRLCKTSLTLTIYENDKTVHPRIVTGNARGSATISQLTIDQMSNGFNQKMEARALKNACKKLGRVFRITGQEGDEMEKESISNDAGVSNVEKVLEKKPEPSKTNPEVEDLGQELYSQNFRTLFDRVITEKQLTKDSMKKDDLMQIGSEVRAIASVEKGSDADKVLKKVYAEYKTKYNL